MNAVMDESDEAGGIVLSISPRRETGGDRVPKNLLGIDLALTEQGFQVTHRIDGSSCLWRVVGGQGLEPRTPSL